MLRHSGIPATFRLFFTIWLIFDIDQGLYK